MLPLKPQFYHLKNRDITYYTGLFQDFGVMNTKSDKLYVINILAVVKTCFMFG